MADLTGPQTSGVEQTKPKLTTVILRRSPFFRVIHASGAIANSPGPEIHIAIYSSPFPLQERMVFETNLDGSFGELIPDPNAAPTFYNEYEADVVLSVENAIQLLNSLQQAVQSFVAEEEDNLSESEEKEP